MLKQCITDHLSDELPPMSTELSDALERATTLRVELDETEAWIIERIKTERVLVRW